ncbi:aminotransferase class V-fold PLP-dependent enzyme [Telmatospirillum sp. J64-1]|uniref:aminotransferase class V-fold PLP-dependent enzyme n=1 Tax=Telmatospirillum sp. J64-1 TaxID=2502183 RepID=UPI00115CD9AA|nr:aminotransferase class V-fold PLP-dependent enzyme [Telmatospirillum sp. J64-1]
MELRRHFPLLDEQGIAYLDNAAMAQMPDLVQRRLAETEAALRANVQRGSHDLAEQADSRFDAARAAVAAFLSAKPEEVIFTGGCTAALDQACRMLAPRLKEGDAVAVSVLEHHSSLLPWVRLAQEKGLELRPIPLTPEGRLDLTDIERIVDKRCRVVVCTHASNVTGAVTDMALLSAAARAAGALLVVDGAQMVPHGKVDPRALGADLYAFAGHKCYGPTGVGVLWGRSELLEDLPPALVGGGMVFTAGFEGFRPQPPPQRFEAGTPPVAQAVGLGAALDWLGGLDENPTAAHLETLTGRLLDGLKAIKGLRLAGPSGTVARVPVVSFTIDGIHPHDISHILGEAKVAVRGGHLCAQPTMAALGVGAVTRASLAPYNNAEDIDRLLAGLERAVRILG